MAELQTDRARLTGLVEGSPFIAKVPVRPNLAQVCRQRIADLEALRDDPENRDEAMELIHALIEVRPRETAGVASLVHGDLARLLVFSRAAQNDKTPMGVSHRGFRGVWLRGPDLN